MTESSSQHPVDQFVQDAAAALPPERDDEPASLRQDILDELADHFACGFRREILKTNGDSQRAIQNVRQRFGDPTTIANRLWFDAMKGKLMIQKILIAACGIAVATCIFFGVLLWRTVNRLESVTTQAAADPEWNPMTLRCVADRPGQPPVTGLEIRLIPRSDGLGPGTTLTTEGQDPIDFGLRRPGYYEINVMTPWREQLEKRVTVQPGRPSETTIVCPVSPPPTMNVRWNVDWPAELRERDDLWYVINFKTSVFHRIDEEVWRIKYGMQNDDERLVAFHPDGRAIDLVMSAGGPSLTATSTRLTFVRHCIEWLRRLPRPQFTNGGRYWADQSYTIYHVALFRWNGEGAPATMLANPMQMAVFGHYRNENSMAGRFVFNPYDDENLLNLSGPRPTLVAPASDSASEIPTITWTITVPPELVAKVIERLEQPVDTAANEEASSIVVRVEEQGTYYVDGHATSESGLASAIRAAMTEGNRTELVIKAAKNAPYSDVLTATDAGKRVGVSAMSGPSEVRP